MRGECPEPGCPMVTANGGYCRRHRRLPGRRPRRSAALNTRPKGRHWTKLREACLKRDGYRCRALLPSGQQCNREDPSGKDLRAHHVVGLKEGGANHLDNLVTLCRRHHDAIEAAKRREAAR